jgi:hypothetical protein
MKDKYKTKVKFLINDSNNDDFIGGSLMAYFPEDKFNNTPGLFTCYAHIGQHSACHIDYANECRPATPAEYKELKAELESIGYNLQIVK